jgi:hypothetical protein
MYERQYALFLELYEQLKDTFERYSMTKAG